jgi:GMP synthase (glutamine-hydrolysing)
MGAGPLPSFAVTHSAPVVLAIQNDPTDPPLLVGDWLESLGIQVRVVNAVEGETCPSTVPDDVDGLLPLGGAMNANQDDVAPWLVNERALLRDAVARDIPVLGLCLGGQLLAAALGGEVRLGKQCEIGLSYVRQTSAGRIDPVIGALPGKTAPATQWHQDEVVTLPTGAELLLENDVCMQGFKVGTAYGLQLHPEIDAELFDWWAKATDPDDEALVRSGIDLAQAITQVAQAQEELVASWRPVTLAWGELVLARWRSRAL